MLEEKTIKQEAEKQVGKAFLITKILRLDKRRSEALKNLLVDLYVLAFKKGHKRKEEEGD